jgi:hypothetical protein
MSLCACYGACSGMGSQATHQEHTGIHLLDWHCFVGLRLASFLQAISQNAGPRQLTVRQMLHSAALRSRQPAITAAAADHLVRLSLTGIESATQRNGHGTDGDVQCVTPRAAATAVTAAAVLQASNPRVKVKMPVVLDVEQGVVLDDGGCMVVTAPAPAPASPSVSDTPRAGGSNSGGAAGEGVVVASPRVESPIRAAAERAPSDA